MALVQRHVQQRRVAVAACTTFRLGISTVTVFPDGLELDDMAYQSYRAACQDKGAPDLEMTDDLFKVVSNIIIEYVLLHID